MLQIGKRKEREFAEFFKKIIFSTEEQDMKEHWDLAVKYDVKMIKRQNRRGDFDENIHWVEIKNVHGDDGWLLGKADFFSFELQDYWVVVKKEDLISLVREKCKDKIKGKGLYLLYQRSGRKDVITMVKTIDLIYISTSFFSKKDS